MNKGTAEPKTFSPNLLAELEEYATTEYDDMDPPPEEWWWDAEYTVYDVPAELQEPVLAELERLSESSADTVRAALAAPNSVLRLHDVLEYKEEYADLDSPMVEQGAVTTNGEIILYDTKYASTERAGRTSGKRQNWTNHLRSLIRRICGRAQLPSLKDFGGDMGKYREALVQMYLDIPWGPVVSVFVCLGGRHQWRDAPDTKYELPEDRPLQRIHEAVTEIVSDRFSQFSLDEAERAAVRKVWDRLTSLWHGRKAQRRDETSVTSELKSLFDSLPVCWSDWSRRNAEHAIEWFAEDICEAEADDD